jgi:extradiol dioxygenase family protein
LELTLQVFHLALPVTDIAASITFYTAYFNCQLGRLSLHLSEDHKSADQCSNRVDGDQIHVPHFGVVLEKGPWQALHQKLKEGGVEFRLEPKIRFAGEAGEQGTFFIKDPSGNTLEFKYFDSADDIFATD